MYDYRGNFSRWQELLDDAGIDYDITNLAGCTYSEIDRHVKAILARATERKRQYGNNYNYGEIPTAN